MTDPNGATNTGAFPRVMTTRDKLAQISSEAERLAREVDDIADLLVRNGVSVPRSKPLAATIAHLLDDLAGTKRMLAHAVLVYGEEGTIAFPAAAVAVSAQQPLRVYANPDNELVVMSRTDITAEGDQAQIDCPTCHQPTSPLLPVCLQCGRALYPAERERDRPLFTGDPEQTLKPLKPTPYQRPIKDAPQA